MAVSPTTNATLLLLLWPCTAHTLPWTVTLQHKPPIRSRGLP